MKGADKFFVIKEATLSPMYNLKCLPVADFVKSDLCKHKMSRNLYLLIGNRDSETCTGQGELMWMDIPLTGWQRKQFEKYGSCVLGILLYSKGAKDYAWIEHIESFVHKCTVATTLMIKVEELLGKRLIPKDITTNPKFWKHVLVYENETQLDNNLKNYKLKKESIGGWELLF